MAGRRRWTPGVACAQHVGLRPPNGPARPRGAILAIQPSAWPWHPDARADVSLASGLQLNPAEATERIAATLRQQVGETLRRRGLVVAMSGGIDSSVCAALAARAAGAGHV